jgi:transcriptional regulator with XRE-family HTH domain
MTVKIKKEAMSNILTRQNKSQVQLAEDLNINHTHLNNLIAGRHSPSPDLRAKIMDKLGITDWDSIFEIKK